MHTATAPIALQYQQLKKEQPHLRYRDAAAALGITEAALLLELNIAKRLDITPKKLLETLPSFGELLSLTRNEGCVLEHTGTIDAVDVMNAHVATLLGFIETRAFLHAWKHILLVEMPKGKELLKGIQVFDQYGTAVTKFFLKTVEEPEAYMTWKHELTLDSPIVFEVPSTSQRPEPIPNNFDISGFLKSWHEIADPHDFFGMLKTHSVTRLQAMQAALGVYTQSFDFHLLPQLLDHIAKTQTPIMIFAGNKGNVQIHQSEIHRVVPMQRDTGVYWLNILDPKFNMHLRMDLISKAFLVTKPSESGPVVSIECYDSQGELLVQFFGLRKPGIPQDANWIRAIQLVQHQ